MLFLLYFLIPWAFYRVCISTATGLSLSLSRVTDFGIAVLHSPAYIHHCMINKKTKRCPFYFYFSGLFRSYCWSIVFQRLCSKILTLFCLRESEKLDQNQIASTSTHKHHRAQIVSASMFSGEQRRGTVLSSPRSTRRA